MTAAERARASARSNDKSSSTESPASTPAHPVADAKRLADVDEMVREFRSRLREIPTEDGRAMFERLVVIQYAIWVANRGAAAVDHWSQMLDGVAEHEHATRPPADQL